MNIRLVPAILLPFLALALQWVLWPWIAPFVWFLFFPTVFFSARLGGLRAGLVSTVLSIAIVWFFFIPPQLSWTMNTPSNLYSVGLFLVMGYLFSETQDRLRPLKEGVQDDLNKPFSVEELLARASGLVLSRRRTVEELSRRAELLRRLAETVEKVAAVRDGQQALDYLFRQGEFADREGPDLPTVVLLDIGLPHLSGLEVLERLRADTRTALLPVVILTSSDEDRDRLKSYEVGTNSFVRKPADFSEFAETVARLGVYWLATNESPPQR